MSPDGRWLASTTADADGRTDGITVVDIKTGTEACRVEHQLESREAVLGLAFSPHGSCLVIIDYRVGLVRLIDRMERGDRERQGRTRLFLHRHYEKLFCTQLFRISG